MTNQAGSVWVWTRDAQATDRTTRWRQLQQLWANSDHIASNGFGDEVQLSADGSVLAVLNQQYLGASEAGVYMFERSAATGLFLRQGAALLPLNATAEFLLMISIALSGTGDVLAIGVSRAYDMHEVSCCCDDGKAATARNGCRIQRR